MVPRRWIALCRGLGDESGNAMIEAALVIPVVLVMVFGIVATGRVVQAQIAVQSVVREASRTLAVAPSLEDGLPAARARALAVASGQGLTPERLQLTVDPGTFARGGTVRTDASYPVTLGDLPLLGLVEVTVSSSHEQRIEQYRSRTAVAP